MALLVLFGIAIFAPPVTASSAFSAKSASGRNTTSRFHPCNRGAGVRNDFAHIGFEAENPISGKSGSHETLSWREMDSNWRSRCKGGISEAHTRGSASDPSIKQLARAEVQKRYRRRSHTDCAAAKGPVITRSSGSSLPMPEPAPVTGALVLGPLPGASAISPFAAGPQPGHRMPHVMEGEEATSCVRIFIRDDVSADRGRPGRQPVDGGGEALDGGESAVLGPVGGGRRIRRPAI
jgi:hypothetical protein